MVDIRITKSDFLDWKACPKSFWLERVRPAEFKRAPPSQFDQLLMADGYAVEAEARKLVESWPDPERWSFQQIFETSEGLHARADLARTRDDGSIDIIEIKASTSLKGSDGSDHVLDACFQKLTAERSGMNVRSVSVMYVNKAYRRKGDIDPNELLVVEDVTAKVAEMSAETAAAIDDALEWLSREEIDENRCECRYIGNTDRHCAAFAHLNPDIPARAAYLLPRISATKLKQLDSEGRLAIEAIEVGDLTAAQMPVLEALQSSNPVINRQALADFVNGLDWPLWFYDYETYGSAVPIADGLGPHQQMPVQFSVHRLDVDGTLEHVEYLSHAAGDQEALVDALRTIIGAEGNAISWNMSFEKGCNDRMAALHTNYADFLADLNARTVDLMDIFKRDWVEAGFEGSISIKKVLPILVPTLAYSEDDVHDGTGAILAWKEMIETEDLDRKKDLERQLREYCRLDTLAMVEIFRRILTEKDQPNG